jgi:Holliday junction resolvasome RuvABC endonuclease subunit
VTTPLVIGLDLSLTCTGVAGAGWTDYIRPKKLTGHPRLDFLVDQVVTFIRNADLVVIEGPSFGGGVKHRHEDLAGLRVMVRHACWRRGIPYALVPPSCRALYAAGKGSASKGEVRTSVADRYGIELEGRARYDEADAYALLAMGLHWLGESLAPVPEKNATGLTGCQWPTPPVATPDLIEGSTPWLQTPTHL